MTLCSYNRHNSSSHLVNVLLNEYIWQGLSFLGQGCLQILQCADIKIFFWSADPVHPQSVRLGSAQEMRQATEERQPYFVPEPAVHCHEEKITRDSSLKKTTTKNMFQSTRRQMK